MRTAAGPSERAHQTDALNRGTDGYRSAFAFHLLSLGVGFLVLFRLNQGQWFFGDEWDFLADRTVVGGERGLWEPHNEHWSTFPILAYGLLFRLVGVETYTPYVALLLVMHLAVIHLLWQLMVRTGTRPWVATLAGASFLVFADGSENLLWAFQIGFVGSVAAGILLLILVDDEGPFGLRDVAAWAVAVGGLMFSGMTVALVAGAGVAAWIRGGVRRFLLGIGPPAVVYLLWLAVSGLRGLETHPPPSLESLASVPGFVVQGLVATLEWGTDQVAVAVILGAALVGFVAWRVLRRRGVPAPLVGAVAGIPALFVLVGVGRTAVNPELADTPRYIYISAALLLPLISLALSDLTRLSAAFWPLPVMLAAAGSVLGVSVIAERARIQEAREQLVKEQFVAAVELSEEGEVFMSQTPDPVYSPDLQMPELLAMRDRLPSGIEPSAVAKLRASAALQTALSSAPPPFYEDAGGPTVRVVGPAGATRADDGCMRFQSRGGSRVRVSYDPPAALQLRSDTGGELAMFVIREGHRLVYPLTFSIAPKTDAFLALGLSEADVVLRPPGGETELCGVMAAGVQER